MHKCRGVTLWSDAAWGLKYSAGDAGAWRRTGKCIIKQWINQSLDVVFEEVWVRNKFYCCRSLAECGVGARIWHWRDEKLLFWLPSVNLVMHAWCRSAGSLLPIETEEGQDLSSHYLGALRWVWQESHPLRWAYYQSACPMYHVRSKPLEACWNS